MTIAEAAAWVHRDERTIRRWVTARLIAGLKTQAGKRIVILQEVVAVDKRLRREAMQGPRARLRRDYIEQLRDTSSRAT